MPKPFIISQILKRTHNRRDTLFHPQLVFLRQLRYAACIHLFLGKIPQVENLPFSLICSRVQLKI